jgi:hypothetical protein
LKSKWPKKTFYWIEGKTLYASIPFTWELPKVFNELNQGSLFREWDNAIVGGPATQLIPGFFDKLDFVEEGKHYPGILQKINPLATRTTIGCVRKCKFCAIGTGKIEPGYRELDDWPDLPDICDNNLLASSNKHFDKVVARLIKHAWANFDQGLDTRLLKSHHAKAFKKIGKPICRLALDHMDYSDQWQDAFDRLREAKIQKNLISSYCIIGFNSTPKEAWQRCEWIANHGVLPYPMWYHALDQLKWNIVTPEQEKLGWTEEKRTHIMGYYYKRRGTKPNYIT